MLFLHPQPEDGPCCGDRDLPYEGNSGHRSVTKGMKTADNYWCPAHCGVTAVAAPGTVSPSAGRCKNKEQTPVPPKGREARTFCCTTEPWLLSQQCHIQMEKSAEHVTVYLRLLLLMLRTLKRAPVTSEFRLRQILKHLKTA
ncbi:hypothetical protein L798_02514 [Zootermopsis nevadensis]|uniref:Uncharacterized protein n=1 Tax=Zootermopsis nevadensis TaxID=136037 RepID=A0A067QRV9_ZOONE|nr:hypothetical protein L798_02514 [Zootermopsis nevadensis]